MKLDENYFASDPAETAKMITDRFGINIITDHKRFCAAFNDFAPKLSRESKAFYVALSEKVGNIYISENDDVLNGIRSPEDVISHASSEIGEYLNADKSAMVARSLAYALNWIKKADVHESAIPENVNPVIEELFKRAESGDNDSCFNLAERLRYGNGISPSPEKAFEWYKKAAERGDCSSQKALAQCFRAGIGTNQDFSQALYWLLKASDQGDYDSQKEAVRCCLYGGPNLSPNPEKARKIAVRYGIHDDSDNSDLLLSAAENGDPHAQLKLANKYYIGNEVPQDLFRAAQLYSKAAEYGINAAMFNYAFCLANGIGVAENMREAVKMYTKASENGDPDSMNNLASLYFQGKGVPRDRTAAAKLWQKAAEAGLANAQYNYGECLYNGWGIPQNVDQAYYWYEKAAEQGDPDAQYSCGWCMYKGEGTPANYSSAHKMLELAAEQNNPHALKLLGYMIMNGQGCEKNYGKAEDYFEKSAELGDPEAAKMLVICWKYGGFYLVPNEKKARQFAGKYGINYNSV